MLARLSPACGAAALLIGLALRADAATKLDNISPRGLQSGATTTITVTGQGFSEASRLLLKLPGGAQPTQVIKPGATANQIQLEFTLPADIPAGVYLARIADAGGVSDAAAIGIDALPQVPFAPQIAALPVALHGDLTGGATLETMFTGKAGQDVVIDVEARRLGGLLNPVLELVDAKGTLLNSSQRSSAIFGDARLESKLPADGAYTIRLHDALYRGAAPGHFRLKVGELGVADLPFPLAVTRGQAAEVQFPGGNLPAEAKAAFTPADAGGFAFAPWPADARLCAMRPIVRVSEHPQAIEAPQQATRQEWTAPGGVSGRISAPGERDQYLVRVKPGAKLRFDVWAHRAGSPLDGMLSVTKEDGAGLGASDDQQDTVDPGLELAVPGDVNAVLVTVQDRLGGGGAGHVYHLGVTDISGGEFSLSAVGDRIQVPQGGTALLRVRANRNGYSGPIKLSFPGGLPAGVSVTGDVIPASATDALVTLAADAGAATAALATSLIGEAETEPVEARARRPVLVDATPVSQTRPMLREELAAAVVAAAPLTVAWGEGAPQGSFTINSKLAAPIPITRAGGAAGAVRLTLITTQVAPLIAEGEKKGQPDVEKTLRLEADVTVPADQSAGTLSIVVPDGLPQMEYDLAVQADLLGPDGQQVIATAVTPARRFKATP